MTSLSPIPATSDPFNSRCPKLHSIHIQYAFLLNFGSFQAQIAPSAWSHVHMILTGKHYHSFNNMKQCLLPLASLDGLWLSPLVPLWSFRSTQQSPLEFTTQLFAQNCAMQSILIANTNQNMELFHYRNLIISMLIDEAALFDTLSINDQIMLITFNCCNTEMDEVLLLILQLVSNSSQKNYGLIVFRCRVEIRGRIADSRRIADLITHTCILLNCKREKQQ